MSYKRLTHKLYKIIQIIPKENQRQKKNAETVLSVFSGLASSSTKNYNSEGRGTGLSSVDMMRATRRERQPDKITVKDNSMDLHECIADKLHCNYHVKVAHAVPFRCQQVVWTVKQMALNRQSCQL